MMKRKMVNPKKHKQPWLKIEHKVNWKKRYQNFKGLKNG